MRQIWVKGKYYIANVWATLAEIKLKSIFFFNTFHSDLLYHAMTRDHQGCVDVVMWARWARSVEHHVGRVAPSGDRDMATRKNSLYSENLVRILLQNGWDFNFYLSLIKVEGRPLTLWLIFFSWLSIQFIIQAPEIWHFVKTRTKNCWQVIFLERVTYHSRITRLYF